MHTALIFFTGSVLTLLFIIAVFCVEDAQSGKRVLFPKIREMLDSLVLKYSHKLIAIDTYLGRGFTRLMLHYAAHGVLQRLLKIVEHIEHKVEYLLRRNKQVAKQIKTNTQKTHLDELTAHKEHTALSEEQKKQIRSHK